MEGRQIHNLLKDEQPQTIAFVLSHLAPAKSAEVFLLFAEELREEIAERLGTIESTPRDLVPVILRNLSRHVSGKPARSYQASGGVRSVEDIRKLLLSGADKVSINTAAVNDPDFVARAADKFGDQCIVVSVDARRRQTQASGGANRSAWEIFTHGGRTATGIDAVEFAIRSVERGAGELLVTSMDRDGTKSGFDLELTRAISDAVHVPVIASGGVGSLDDLVDGVKVGHASAVLAASIFHFGTFTIGQAKQYLAGHGIPMRMD